MQIVKRRKQNKTKTAKTQITVTTYTKTEYEISFASLCREGIRLLLVLFHRVKTDECVFEDAKLTHQQQDIFIHVLVCKTDESSQSHISTLSD